MLTCFQPVMHILLLLLPPQQQPPIDSITALITAGKMQEALRAVKTLDPALPQTAHLTGVINFNLHNYKDAIVDFEQALRGETKDSPAWRESSQLLGRSLYLTGRTADALPSLENAWKLGERGPDLLYMLGNAYIDKQNPNGARFAFADLYGLDRNAAAAYLLTAKMMQRRNARDLAAKQLEFAILADPKLPGAHYEAALSAIARADSATALAQLAKELELEPDHAPSYALMGEILLQNGKLDASIDALRRSVWLNPYQTGPYLLLGQAYLQKSDLVNAEGVLRRAAKGDPDNLQCRELLAKVLALKSASR